MTSAALLLTITLISFANGLSFMKMFGIGTTGGIVPGDGAVLRSTQASRSYAPSVAWPQPNRFVVLEDGSRLEIGRDCVIGRDPHGSDAAQRGYAR